jgi:serpin B
MISAVSCKKDTSQEPKQPKQITLPAKANEVIALSNGFGIDLFRVTSLEEEGNLMLSPLSASTALTMLLNGCNGQTYDQVRNMLGYEALTIAEINETYRSLVAQLLDVDPDVQLALANAVWYRQDFMVKPAFLDEMNNSYKANIEALDFFDPSALETINNWASDNTNGRIPKVLDQIEPDAAMFLMNALYFKGTWTYQFLPGQTALAPFHPENGNIVDVDMMRNLIPVKYHSGNGVTAVELPYGRQNFSMVIILPDNSLSEYLPDFDMTDWSNISAGLDSMTEPVEAEITLPKFRFEYEKQLNDQLKSLGMIDAFKPYIADLSGISDAEIFVDFVKQNTFVDVNEEGTEAAAVTTVGISFTSLPQAFIFDKPFIFAIRERVTNTLLFIGKIELPEY